MKKNRQWRKQASALCAETRPEDGVDPRLLAKQETHKTDHHQTDRLCKRVSQVLAQIIQGELDDPLFFDVEIIDVKPTNSGQYLLVEIGHNQPGLENSRQELMSALNQLQGYMRAQIAQSINRKRVPVLKFQYVGSLESR